MINSIQLTDQMSSSVISKASLEKAVLAIEEYVVVYGNTNNDYFDTEKFDKKLCLLTIEFLSAYSPQSKNKIEVEVVRLPDCLAADILIRGLPEYLNLIENNPGLNVYQ